MVWKLLRKNISVSQIVGYALANLVGLVIVLSAIKFYDDISGVMNDEESFISRDYIIISKRVSTFNTLGSGSPTYFTDDEIADIESQPWVKKVGKFTAADYKVSANINFGNRGLRTYIFLESIPDEFIDVKSEDWKFDPEHPVVPIIMSKDYLTLYNFGFASSQGMQQLSEDGITALSPTLFIDGNNQSASLDARIVGFSSRLNTIAVPESFIEYSNAIFGSPEPPKPSRLIIEANTPGDPAIKTYLDKNGYEQAGDKVDNARATYFLNLITTIVIAVGALISLLAFFILMLSIYLLLQKNREKLHDLMLLGYSPSQVSRCYFMLIGIVNVAVLIIAIVIMLLASRQWSAQFDALDIESSSPLRAIIIGVSIIVVITAVNFYAIARRVRGDFYNK